MSQTGVPLYPPADDAIRVRHEHERSDLRPIERRAAALASAARVVSSSNLGARTKRAATLRWAYVFDQWLQHGAEPEEAP